MIYVGRPQDPPRPPRQSVGGPRHGSPEQGGEGPGKGLEHPPPPPPRKPIFPQPLYRPALILLPVVQHCVRLGDHIAGQKSQAASVEQLPSGDRLITVSHDGAGPALSSTMAPSRAQCRPKGQRVNAGLWGAPAECPNLHKSVLGRSIRSVPVHDIVPAIDEWCVRRP